MAGRIYITDADSTGHFDAYNGYGSVCGLILMAVKIEEELRA